MDVFAYWIGQYRAGMVVHSQKGRPNPLAFLHVDDAGYCVYCTPATALGLSLVFATCTKKLRGFFKRRPHYVINQKVASCLFFSGMGLVSEEAPGFPKGNIEESVIYDASLWEYFANGTGHRMIIAPTRAGRGVSANLPHIL